MTVPPDEPSAATADSVPEASAELPRQFGNGLSGDLAVSPTEQRNRRTLDIDVLPTLGVLQLLNAEDATVPVAVERVLGRLTLVVDEAADRLRRGGRVHYFGAGSSGRIAMLDAAELVPTFGMERGLVVAHLAGGDEAMVRAVEGAEDNEALGAAEASAVVGALDVVIGLSASGRTPYVAGALSAASARGAFTAVITSNPDSPLEARAEVAIVPETGPEVIAGSTRMKATTAMKLILNSFSTALMIRLGKTYSNLMVEVSATNIKLRDRKVRILREATGADQQASDVTLAAAGGDLRLAMIMLLCDADAQVARDALANGGGSVRGALGVLGSTQAP
jgi:N-acetylmuramic acid 6-phosphate etherase